MYFDFHPAMYVSKMQIERIGGSIEVESRPGGRDCFQSCAARSRRPGHIKKGTEAA